MARARPAVADAFDRACFGRCEFPQLLQDNALRRAIADTGRSGGRDADRDACAALIRWQLASRQGMLPPYDETLLRRELDLFPDWYIARHVGVTLDKAQRETLSKVFQRILDNNLAQARVYVHRDYHSRNLMVSDPNPRVLDFQDAGYRPITYDLVSLLLISYVEGGV